MPLAMSTSLRDQLASLVQKPIKLLHIESTIDIRLANWHEPVTFDGELYLPYPFEVGSIRISGQGSVPGLIIKTPAADGYIIALLEQNDAFIDCSLHILKVFEDHLADNTMVVRSTYTIDSVEGIVEDQLELSCTPRIFKDLKVPRRAMFRGTCPWLYKGEGCWLSDGLGGLEAPVGFTNESTYCTRTLDACKLHNNFSRIGCAPAMPWGHPFLL